MSSTVGMRLRMTIYGESHGPSIGISPRFPHIGRKRINLLLKVVFLKERRPEWLYVPAL